MQRQSKKQSAQRQGPAPSPNGKAKGRRARPKLHQPPPPPPKHDQDESPPLPMRQGTVRTGRRMNWLWQGRLAFSSVAILQGEKGSGKSSWLRAIAADVTGGPRLLGERGKPRRAGRVLWYAGEEDLDDKTMPACQAAGCDLSMMHFADDKGEIEDTLTLPRDAKRLKALILEFGAVLVVIDPLLAFVAASADIEGGGVSARLFLRCLRKIAWETGALILLTRNLTKSTADGALASGRGSGELGNAARSVLHTHTLPQTPYRYGLALAAGNDGPPLPTLTYRIVAVDGLGVLKVDGTTSLTADELVRGDEGDVDRSQLEYAKALIRAALPTGEILVSVLRSKAEMAGISIRTLQAAKQRLGVTDRREGRREDTQVYWIAPKGGYSE